MTATLSTSFKVFEFETSLVASPSELANAATQQDMANLGYQLIARATSVKSKTSGWSDPTTVEVYADRNANRIIELTAESGPKQGRRLKFVAYFKSGLEFSYNLATLVFPEVKILPSLEVYNIDITFPGPRFQTDCLSFYRKIKSYIGPSYPDSSDCCLTSSEQIRRRLIDQDDNAGYFERDTCSNFQIPEPHRPHWYLLYSDADWQETRRWPQMPSKAAIGNHVSQTRKTGGVCQRHHLPHYAHYVANSAVVAYSHSNDAEILRAINDPRGVDLANISPLFEPPFDQPHPYNNSAFRVDPKWKVLDLPESFDEIIPGHALGALEKHYNETVKYSLPGVQRMNGKSHFGHWVFVADGSFMEAADRGGEGPAMVCKTILKPWYVIFPHSQFYDERKVFMFTTFAINFAEEAEDWKILNFLVIFPETRNLAEGPLPSARWVRLIELKKLKEKGDSVKIRRYVTNSEVKWGFAVDVHSPPDVNDTMTPAAIDGLLGRRVIAKWRDVDVFAQNKSWNHTPLVSNLLHSISYIGSEHPVIKTKIYVLANNDGERSICLLGRHRPGDKGYTEDIKNLRYRYDLDASRTRFELINPTDIAVFQWDINYPVNVSILVPHMVTPIMRLRFEKPHRALAFLRQIKAYIGELKTGQPLNVEKQYQRRLNNVLDEHRDKTDYSFFKRMTWQEFDAIEPKKNNGEISTANPPKSLKIAKIISNFKKMLPNREEMYNDIPCAVEAFSRMNDQDIITAFWRRDEDALEVGKSFFYFEKPSFHTPHIFCHGFLPKDAKWTLPAKFDREITQRDLDELFMPFKTDYKGAPRCWKGDDDRGDVKPMWVVQFDTRTIDVETKQKCVQLLPHVVLLPNRVMSDPSVTIFTTRMLYAVEASNSWQLRDVVVAVTEPFDAKNLQRNRWVRLIYPNYLDDDIDWGLTMPFVDEE